MMQNFEVSVQNESPQYGDARNASIEVFHGRFTCSKVALLEILKGMRLLWNASYYRFTVSTVKSQYSSIEFGGIGPDPKPFPMTIEL